jgi:hypothetical protein
LEPRHLLSTDPPSIVAVEVSGSEWTPEYVTALRAAEHGEAGYAVAGDATGQLVLPWRGVDRVHVRFDGEVSVETSDLELHGANVAAYSFSEFFYDGNSFTATWRLAEPITADNLLAIVNGDIEDLAGLPLAGDLLLRFGVLPGDVNRDGLVSRADIAASLPEFADTMGAGYDPLHDLTGDGVVNILDAVAIRDAIGASLPSTQPLGAATIAELSPADGEEMVSLTRETIVRFSAAVDPATVTPDAFYAIANGGRLDGTIRVSATERFATIFYADPLPASTEVRVVVDGDLIAGRDGLLLDADNDGQPGGRTTADFRTLPITRIPGTRVWGYVYDSYNKTPEGADIPIVGATIRVDAFPEANVTTDATGRFELGLADANADGTPDGLPAPEFFVHIDGTTAVNAPPGTIYPSVGKPFHSVPGQATQLNMMGTPFNIYLPPMAMADVVPLSATEDTPVHFGPEGMATCAAILIEAGADPASCALMQVTYPAGSAIDESGNPATQAIIIPVPPDRIPAPLPPGVDPKLVISVQAPGASQFDVPAPISFPNIYNLEPGTSASISSFNHDAGRWESVGTATVSIDGTRIVSDPGVGILAPGWHIPEWLVDVFGSPEVPDKTNDFISLVTILGNFALARVPLASIDVDWRQGGKLLLEMKQLSNDILAGSLTGFGTADKVGILGGVLSVTGAIGVVVVGGGGLATVFGGLGIAGTVLSVGADLFQLQDAITHLLNSPDPPCNLISSAHWNELASAALTCVRAVTQSFAAFAELEPELNAAMTTVAAAVLRQGITDRFGNDPQSLRITIDSTTQPLRVTHAETGASAIDPGTGLPYSITLTDLIRDGVSAADAAALEQVVQSEVLVDGSDTLAIVLSGETFVNLDNAIALLEAAKNAMKRPRPGTYVSIGGLRARTNSAGAFHVRLPANSPFVGSYFHGGTGLAASQSFRTGGPGSVLHLPVECLDELDLNDADQDGVPDSGELVVGTSPGNPDTDGDGIGDLAEIQQNLDPLGGLSFPTGIVASLLLLGTAKEVVAAGDIDNPQRQIAYLATGSYGLAIVDASDFDLPIILGQLDLPGDAVDVAVDSRFDIAVVAAGAGGMHFVDIADPMQPQLIRTIPSATNQVEVANGIVYAGQGSQVRAYGLIDGTLFRTLSLPGGGAITGMAREGEVLFTMDAARNLRAIDVGGFRLSLLNSITVPHGAGRLFVDNGVAYGAAINSFDRGGFSTVDVSNPAAMTVISGSDVVSPFIAPGTAVVANGSGLALLVGSNGVNVVDIMDVSNPAQTNVSVTRFNLPAPPQSVTIASGIGFIAGGTAGLQVVNFVPFDNQGTAPAVSISSPVADADPNTDGVQVVEGSSVPVRVSIQDDVQVRNVELLVDGRVVANDVSAPFDFFAPVPALSTEVTATSIQVRATDTGGNSALSNVLDFGLSPDLQPPIVTFSNPSDGSTRFDVSAVTIAFDEPLDISRVDPTKFSLVSLGPDGAIGGGDDISVGVSALLPLSDLSVSVAIGQMLPPGEYLLSVAVGAVADRAGNAFAASYTLQFEIIDVDPNAFVWIGPSGGDWTVAENWSTGVVPGAGDDVVIPGELDMEIVVQGSTPAVKNLINYSTVKIHGSGHLGNAIFTIFDSATNHGVIRLESAGSTYHETLAVAPGATLTNAADGVIEARVGSGGTRTMTGAVENFGTIRATGIFFGGVSTLTHAGGVLEGMGAGLFFVNAGRLNFTGGATTGAVYVVNSELAIASTVTTPSTIHVSSADSRLLQSDSPAVTVWVHGNGQWGHATLTVPVIVTNHGVIRLESGGSTYNETLAVAPGATLVNAADGTIEARVGSGGNRTMMGAVENFGTIHVATSLSIAINSAMFANAGTLEVTGGNLNIVQSGTSPIFVNSGTINIAPGRIVNTSGGPFSQGSTGAIESQMSGTASSQYGRLITTGGVTLDGTFDVNPVGGFVPAVGNVLTAVTYASRTGQFAAINGHGIQYTPTYGPTSLTLTVASVPAGSPEAGVVTGGELLGARRQNAAGGLRLDAGVRQGSEEFQIRLQQAPVLRASRRPRLAVRAVDDALAAGEF